MRILLTLWRWPILLALYGVCDPKEKKAIRQDVYRSIRWEIDHTKHSFFWCLVYEMNTRKSSRNVFYFRTRRHKILTALCRLFWPKADSVEIGANYIGPGLTIPHGNVILYAKAIGNNCHVGPGVVIGQIKNGQFPCIGNDVLIGANATVLGDINIGNNVSIGAACLIRKNIPDNTVVFSDTTVSVVNKKTMP